MSAIEIDKKACELDRHEPHVYLKDIFDRLPTHPADRIEELLL